MLTDTDLGLEIWGIDETVFTTSRYSVGGEELLVEFRDKTEAYILTTIKVFSQQRVGEFESE